MIDFVNKISFLRNRDLKNHDIGTRVIYKIQIFVKYYHNCKSNYFEMIDFVNQNLIFMES